MVKSSWSSEYDKRCRKRNSFWPYWYHTSSFDFMARRSFELLMESKWFDVKSDGKATLGGMRLG